MKIPKTFFGWSNLKWLIKELIAMYSNQDSYFSKKRIESAIAFLSATFLILWHAYEHRATITNSEILADAALLFGVAGYTLNHIQKEKKEEAQKTSQVDTPVAPSNNNLEEESN